MLFRQRKDIFHRGSVYGHGIFSKKKSEGMEETESEGVLTAEQSKQRPEQPKQGQGTWDTHRLEVAKGLREEEQYLKKMRRWLGRRTEETGGLAEE